MTRRLVLALAGALLLALPATAGAAPRPRDLWATVNVCDTALHPDRMGVRARMPGNGTRQAMYVRFRAQYFDPVARIWHDIGAGAASRWIRLGSARVRQREAGYTFSLRPPPAGGRWTLRGVVDFQWRERRRVGRRTKRVRRDGRVRRVVVRRGRLRTVVVRRARANTKGGFASAKGSDPRGHTAGVCEIR